MGAAAAVLVGLTVAAVAFNAGPRQAFACSCAPLPDSPALAQDYMKAADAVVLAEVGERTNGANDPYPAARVRIERAYDGNVEPEVNVTSANCNGIIVDFKRGERWLMTLDQRDGGWQAHGCSAGLVDGVLGRPRYNDGDVWLAAMNEIIPPPTGADTPLSVTLVVDDNDDEVPAFAIAFTIAGLMTVMLGCVYVAQRRARA